MKKNFKLPVVAALTVALTAPTMVNASYPDVIEGSWYAAAVESAVSNGLLSGYEDGSMKPGNPVTRAEMATILSKAFGATEKAKLDGFYDVNEGQWFHDAMAKAVYMEIFTGDNNKCLNPNAPITREEAAIVIAKAFELNHSGEDVLAKFSDKDNVSEWALSFVSALVENKYMSGNENNELNPKGNITRAELAQVMANITNTYVVEKATVTEDYNGTVVVRAADVVMKDLTVDGNVIVADGVGRGDFTLDNVTINGDLVIRGGGVNSINLLNGAKINGKITVRNHGGKTRIAGDKVTLNELDINTPVILDADCTEVNALANVEVLGEVGTINVDASDVNITGTGKVTTVNANEDNVDVSVKGANVVAATGTTGVTAGDKDVEAGSSETVKTTTTSSSGGSSSGGGSGSSIKTRYLTYTVKEADVTIGEETLPGYEITADADNDKVTDFDDIRYKVTIEGDITAETTTINDGTEAIEFAATLLDSVNMERLVNTLDAMGVTAKYNDEEHQAQINLALATLLDGTEYYEKLENARDEALSEVGGDASKVSLRAVFAKYETEEGAVKEAAKAMLGKVKNNSLYSTIFEYFVTEEWDFIESLIK